ncbi:MAG TPA: hypothetical protein VHG30_11905 [Microvirga sp.]|nr:hypothetical protein [Microvirga sp.]
MIAMTSSAVSLRVIRYQMPERSDHRSQIRTIPFEIGQAAEDGDRAVVGQANHRLPGGAHVREALVNIA